MLLLAVVVVLVAVVVVVVVVVVAVAVVVLLSPPPPIQYALSISARPFCALSPAPAANAMCVRARECVRARVSPLCYYVPVIQSHRSIKFSCATIHLHGSPNPLPKVAVGHDGLKFYPPAGEKHDLQGLLKKERKKERKKKKAPVVYTRFFSVWALARPRRRLDRLWLEEKE